ncbi:MAG: hypothetical protein H0W90_16135 [Actinobacteria bacterium]|nr:hypothetical protein [Actinomycetota bacterium]
MTATETIRKEIFVDAAPETAFRVFTEQISDWWPLGKYSIYLEDAETVGFEDRDGWQPACSRRRGRTPGPQSSSSRPDPSTTIRRWTTRTA